MTGDDRIMTQDEVDEMEELEEEIEFNKGTEERIFWDTTATQVLNTLVRARLDGLMEDVENLPDVAALYADDLLAERRKRFPGED